MFLEDIVDFWHTNLLVYRTFLEGFKALGLQSTCLYKYTQRNEFSNIHVPLEFALRNSISLEILEPNNQPEFNTVGYHFSDRIPGIGSN